MARGVDIYRYQTVTDWRAFARDVRYAWVKLTNGNGPAVVRGDRQVNGCRSVGVPVGGYHWAVPGDPVHQAGVFVGELRRLQALDLAPALDLEDEKFSLATARPFGIAFCKAIAAAGYRPAVYMSASWAGTLRPDQWGIPGLVIWIAAYGSNDGIRRAGDVTRHYSGRVDVHQYTSVGRVPGVSGAVDLNWALTGVPRNSTSKETDMELTDRVDWDAINDLGPTTVGHKILSTWQNSIAARSYAQQAAVAALADKDVDVDQLAAAVVAKQRELLEEIVREVVPDEVAEDVVRKLGEKLRPLE
jgi:GH25 family lysozyme M1 (1,4-beta-N-acetylmuramidase)